jgi:dTDP-4-dehydrorhamnose 3,5-epimerase
MGRGGARRPQPPVYLSEGLGHAFLALEDNSTVMYLCSTGYTADREHTINALDPALDITWPAGDDEPIISDRGSAADMGQHPGLINGL